MRSREGPPQAKETTMKRTLKLQSLVLILSLLLGSLPFGAVAQVPQQTEERTIADVEEDKAALVAELNADPLVDGFVGASDTLGTQINQQTSTMTQEQRDYVQQYIDYIQDADEQGTVPEDGVTQELSIRLGFGDPNTIDQLQQPVDGYANEILNKYEGQFSAYSDDEVSAILRTAFANEFTEANAALAAAANPARDACIRQCRRDYQAELAIIAAALLARLRWCRRLIPPASTACKKAAYAIAAAATAAASIQLAVCIAACYVAHPDKKEAEEAAKQNQPSRLRRMSSDCSCDPAAKRQVAAGPSTLTFSNLFMSVFSGPTLALR